MAKEFIEEYDENEDEQLFALEDEDGNVENFWRIGSLEYKGAWYSFFQKDEPETEDEEDEVVIFRTEGEGEDIQLFVVEDEQLMDEVFAEFCKQYENFEDWDEAESLDK